LAGDLQNIATDLNRRAGDLTTEMNALLSDIAERRSYDRYDTHAPVSVTVKGRTIKSIIDNVSASGACIFKVEGLEMGQDVRLAFEDGHKVSGKVMWINERLFGVAFDGVTLPSATISRVRAAGGDARAA
jgi:hypothetical protein